MASPNQRQFKELLAEMARRGESLRRFALRSEIDKSVLSRLVNGKLRRWDPSIVSKVESATEKAVGFPQFAAFAERLQGIKARRKRARAA